MSDRLLQEAWSYLGVNCRASVEDVRAAWKRKLKQVHPDVGGSKEAAQHATNMREVLVAWIEAGRPDLETASHSATAAYARAQSRTQNFTWQDVPQYHYSFDWNARCRIAWWKIVAIWAVALLLNVLSAGPWNEYMRTGAHQPELPHPYNCPGVPAWTSSPRQKRC
jgi:hypothetical protein